MFKLRGSKEEANTIILGLVLIINRKKIKLFFLGVLRQKSTY